jgi:hypothetical protein
MTRSTLSLNLDDARRIIAAGELKATEMGTPYNIAVTDAGRRFGRPRTDGWRLARQRGYRNQ